MCAGRCSPIERPITEELALQCGLLRDLRSVHHTGLRDAGRRTPTRLRELHWSPLKRRPRRRKSTKCPTDEQESILAPRLPFNLRVDAPGASRSEKTTLYVTALAVFQDHEPPTML